MKLLRLNPFTAKFSAVKFVHGECIPAKSLHGKLFQTTRIGTDTKLKKLGDLAINYRYSEYCAC